MWILSFTVIECHTRLGDYCHSAERQEREILKAKSNSGDVAIIHHRAKRPYTFYIPDEIRRT